MINLACKRCRDKKLRCNGQFPCDNCTERGMATECQSIMRKSRPRKHRESIRRINSDGSSMDLPLSPSKGESSNSFNQAPRATKKTTESGVSRADEALIIIAQEAMESESLSAAIVEEAYFWRVAAATHSCVHLPTVLDSLHKIFSEEAVVIVEIDELALSMITVALGMQFLPKDKNPLELVQRINRVKGSSTPPSRQRMLGTTARQIVERQILEDTPSLAQVQTIILLLLYDQDDEATKRQLLLSANNSAEQLGMNQISSSDNIGVAQEMMVRCWWFLVARNWLGGISSLGIESDFAPFSTRLPLEMSDDNLLEPQKHSSSNAAYLPVRYSLTLIKLAHLVKKLKSFQQVDHYTRQQLRNVTEEEFDSFCSSLPARYSLVVVEVIPAGTSLDLFYEQCKTSVERWFLHQHLYHAFLELYYFEPHAPVPAVALSLSYHILDIGTGVSGLCWVHDSLRVGITNIVKACTLLTFELLYKTENQVLDVNRSLVLKKVFAAIRKSHEEQNSRKEDFTFLLGLLNLENQKWNQRHQPQEGGAFDPNEQNLSAFESEEFLGHFANELTGLTNSPHIEQSSGEASASLLSEATTQSEVEDGWALMIPSDGAFSPLFDASSVDINWKMLYDLVKGDAMY